MHAARVSGGIGFLNVGTLGVLTVGRVGIAGGMRRESEALPWTPLWSRNDAKIVWVGPVWVDNPSGSHIAI